jgi:hypothetical protein
VPRQRVPAASGGFDGGAGFGRPQGLARYGVGDGFELAEGGGRVVGGNDLPVGAVEMRTRICLFDPDALAQLVRR